MGLRVKLKHCRAAGFGCGPGLREFGKKHGLSYHKLITEGLDIQELRGIKDARAQGIVQLVEREADNGQ